ncbi:hypothetical protein AAGF08_18945 [Algoriphagus sp. SE2]|uniref:hypothetical protein n=1 Tax=Algoriphagus sp. SE2 TaxID=3141536 RepID=UPI0031CD6E51
MRLHSLIERWNWQVILLMLLLSCDNNEIKLPDTGYTYFPLKEGNSWYYTVTLSDNKGEVTGTYSEKWVVNGNNYIEIYNSDDVYQGYRALFHESSDGSIKNWVGQWLEYLNTDYVDKSEDELFLVSTHTGYIDYDHWIKGGKPKIKTPFGLIECIRVKSYKYYSAYEKQLVWLETETKFLKGIGPYEMENREYDNCKGCLSNTRKWKLNSYKLN